MKLKTRLKRLASALLVLMILLTLVIVGRGFWVPSRQLSPEPPQPFELRGGYVERLATSIGFETVSDVDTAKMDMTAWESLGSFIQNAFPLTHQTLKRQNIGPCSWVYEWAGAGQHAPILLLAHTDVVPVEESKRHEWTHPPFAGHIDETFIWGRGALDDKVSVFAILEAIEGLLAQGKTPSRPIFLGFGCDEEVAVRAMLEHLGPEVSGPLKFVFANLWLLQPVILRVLSGKVSTNATVRTTTAATVFHGGVRENILPKTASAQINFRILPGETRESVLARVKEVVDDEHVKIEVPTRGFSGDPTTPSAAESKGYMGRHAKDSRRRRTRFARSVRKRHSILRGGTWPKYGAMRWHPNNCLATLHGHEDESMDSRFFCVSRSTQCLWRGRRTE